MRRPALILVFLSVLLLALGTTGGALMSLLRPQIQEFAADRIFAARAIHSLSGSREYDAEVVAEIVFTIEAGLSFFHTHAEGLGLVILFLATVITSLVRPGWLRRGLSGLIGLSGLFPIGYLGYSAFILLYGRDRGIELAEGLLLIPSGSSAIVALAVLVGAVGFLLVNGRVRRLATPSLAAAPIGTPARRSDAWRRPPRVVVLAAALLITLAELGGAAMGRFKPDIDAFTRARVLERPEVHGLVGAADVDNEIVDEVRVKVDGALRLFHLHGEGNGLMIFALAMVIATFVRTRWLRAVLYGLVTLGGLGFPLGYVVWASAIPLVGVEPGRALAAAWVLVPLGATLLLGLWVTTFVNGVVLVSTWARGPEETEDRARGLRLPPTTVILAAVALLVLAEIGGGAMTKFKADLERANRAAVEARPLVHGLVGVRQIDAPVIDTLLARSDFALRLFHLHGEGMALVMLAGGIIIRNFVVSRRLAAILLVLLAAGGLLYPFGYLAWSAMIPMLGLQPAKDLAEWLFWIPFGGAALVAMALVTLVLASQLILAGEPPRGR
jgi:hypothetical protein